MKHTSAWLLSLVLLFGVGLMYAEDPTSKFLPLSPLVSSLPASSTGNAVQFEVRDQSTGGVIIFSEAHNVDTDAASNISNDTGFVDLLLGRPGGLVSANFPAGSSRYLDVTQGGASLLTARVPLYASAFAISAPNEIPGNLTLVNSTSMAGNIMKGGTLFLHNFGTNNFFAGANAGNLSTSGFGGNTGLGVNALQSNTTGTANTASGISALNNNTTGYWNTATGANALFSNTTGFQNTAIGTSALVNNTTASNNTASGFEALKSNTTGFQNTAIGASALLNNTTGINNTASGFEALRTNTGSANTASGFDALKSNTTGGYNTASGFEALLNNTTGSYNTAIGYGADVLFHDLTNATAVGYNAIVDANNKIRLGSTSVIVIEGQVAYTFTSDKNQKENFQAVEGEQVLSKIRGLNLTSWNYIGHDPKQFRHYGPVAQEFFGAFGHDGVGTIGTNTTINSGDMEGILMIAVQALEKRTSELATLKAENADLKARLEKLERSIGTLVVKAE